MNVLSASENIFLSRVEETLRAGEKQNKRLIESIAHPYGITDQTTIKELTELAIVNVAREISRAEGTHREKFDRLVSLYNNQMNLSHRTSLSVLLQQYSTPAPIAYLMGVFCRIDEMDKLGGRMYEPSAGNGLLTIAADPKICQVNEIDDLRNRNLLTQGFSEVTKQDASKDDVSLHHNFHAVITNPPFGKLETPVKFDSFRISELDHVMAIRALETMKYEGRAAIIIGGHTRWDKLDRIQMGKNRIFLNYLYHYYHVLDVIPIEGRKLYTRQGTGFPTRLILIEGRKANPSGAAPLKEPLAANPIKSFDELYLRVMQWTPHFYYPSLSHNVERNFYQLKEKYPQTVLLISEGNEYKSIGADAVTLQKLFGLTTELYQDIEKKMIQVVTIPESQITNYMKKLANENIKFAVADELQLPKSKLNMRALEAEASALYDLFCEDGLGMLYVPASAAKSLNTQVPDSMGYETHSALERIKTEVGGSMDNFVRHRLGYRTMEELYKALSAEQIDAVAMAIYNIEARNQGTIIGDQTGIGKGRVAAAMIRYGVQQKLKPVFITEKASLFSSLYRDMCAIGCAHLKPFIINGREAKSNIKDEEGNIIYEALTPSEQATVFNNGELPAWCDFAVGTYSQFNSPDLKPTKPHFLLNIAEGNIMIMDESHNSSGSSNTGAFMRTAVSRTKGVVFLSATFAKRPDNLPIYAMKTCISEANLTREELVEAITKGGVALQEVISSQLVAEGQMIRRERSSEGIEVNYISLDEYAQEHIRIADEVTDILRNIIDFQTDYVNKAVTELDKIAAKEGKAMEIREGTSKAGVDNLPYFSKVFNVINQLLFSIKAVAVADRAIARLKEGKKPVIAFASTMGSFVEQMENDRGLLVGDGDLINTDFAEVLKRGLEGVLRYTEKDIDGQPIFREFELTELPSGAVGEYGRIMEKIETISTGISISPIDVIIQKIERAGYSVAEVTGRKFSLQLNEQGNKGLVTSRKKLSANDAFRMFNNNETDVLMINQSGSTGESAHAIPTSKVPASEVKQRVMIVLQAELDINTEVQKRGRIDRTGQILKAIYDYLTSVIPAEKRLMMMLQKKLKSLDANTTSNQKQSTKILDVPDFLNKYGDKVVEEYLLENPEINELLGSPLSGSKKEGSEAKAHIPDAAHMVSGRVAVLSTQMQTMFYNDITERYNDYIEYLKQVGEYDLEVEALNLEAKIISTTITTVGKGGESAFGEDSILEKVEANILKKPFSKTELEKLISEALAGKTADEQQSELLEHFHSTIQKRWDNELKTNAEKYDFLVNNVEDDNKAKKLKTKGDNKAYLAYLSERKKELQQAETDAAEVINMSYKNKKEHLGRILKFFKIGKALCYPVVTFDNGQENVVAVCLGLAIDRKKENPYAPSAVKVRIAIANSLKYFTIPVSYHADIAKIMAASIDLEDDQEQLLNYWQEQISAKVKDRGIRYIITGNLLQAFGSGSGKLVSYTTNDGQTKKGILLPEEWQPQSISEQRISVPIVKGLPLLKSMRHGSAIHASNHLSFFRENDDYQVVLPMSRAKAGDIYIDRDLMALVKNGMFERASDKMKALLPFSNLKAFVQVLQDKYSISLSITQTQMELLQKDTTQVSTRLRIMPPPPEERQSPEERERLRLLDIEAEALILLLQFAA